jgi:SAM-dependent methyltransferase
MANIGQAESILEIGCGWGIVARELAQRRSARVIGLDSNAPIIESARSSAYGLNEQLTFIHARAQQIPLPDCSIDIVFTQFSLLWTGDLSAVIGECNRVLRGNGCLVAIEPDFGGLMEYPGDLGLRELWMESLVRAGADPIVGRKLPQLFQQAGLVWQAYLPDRVEYSTSRAVDFLIELLQQEGSYRSLQSINSLQSPLLNSTLVHLPIWMLLGRKSN